jgi:hypothetical protein
MDLKPLETLNIDELDKLIASARTRRGELCDALVAECRAKEFALQEENKAKLAKYNIPYKASDAAPGNKTRKRSKEATYKKGQTYRHPDDPKLTFKAGGSYPKWVQELHKGQRRAVLVPEIVTPIVTQKAG